MCDHKPNCENFIQLARLAHDSFDGRRASLWRLNFSFWAALGWVVYFCVDRKIRILPNSGPMLYCVVATIPFIAYCVSQYLMHQANEIDKHFKHDYMARAEGRSQEPKPELGNGWWDRIFYYGIGNVRYPWSIASIVWLAAHCLSTASILYLAAWMLSCVKSL